ncbi:hypothetical protein [Acinetobacter sp. ANC 3789]|uniref:hypothetical protein n=1 Tax=Acinetobacter sp. ANC 3789 TaxID=1217714 RepID=UPI0012DB2B7E|nr:hypothetical protein [Acinetobacter sp. ANC 3789]
MPKLTEVQNIAVTIMDYLYLHDVVSLVSFSEKKIKAYTSLLGAIDEVNEKRKHENQDSEIYKHFLICCIEILASGKAKINNLDEMEIVKTIYTAFLEKIVDHKFSKENFLSDMNDLVKYYHPLTLDDKLSYKFASQMLYFEYDNVTISTFKKFLDLKILNSDKYQYIKAEKGNDFFDKVFLRAMLFLEFESTKKQIYIQKIYYKRGFSVSLRRKIEDIEKAFLYVKSIKKSESLIGIKLKSIVNINLNDHKEIQEYLKNLNDRLAYNKLFFYNIPSCIGLMGCWFLIYFKETDLKKPIYQEIFSDFIFGDNGKTTCAKDAKNIILKYGLTLTERTLNSYYDKFYPFYNFIRFLVDELINNRKNVILFNDIVDELLYKSIIDSNFELNLGVVINHLKRK